MRRSTAMAPPTPRATPAVSARAVSGRTPTTTSTRSTVRVKLTPVSAVLWPVTVGRPPSRPMWVTVVPVTTSTWWRPGRDRAGADDQLVVTQRFDAAVRVADLDRPPGRVDPLGVGVQPQAQSGLFQVGAGAVGQVAPVGYLAGDVVRDAADGEVGVG